MGLGFQLDTSEACNVLHTGETFQDLNKNIWTTSPLYPQDYFFHILNLEFDCSGKVRKSEYQKVMTYITHSALCKYTVASNQLSVRIYS